MNIRGQVIIYNKNSIITFLENHKRLCRVISIEYKGLSIIIKQGSSPIKFLENHKCLCVVIPIEYKGSRGEMHE